MNPLLASRVGFVDWVDLGTPDIAGALHFYREVLGWGYSQVDAPVATYYTATTDDGAVAGLRELGSGVAPETPAAWMIYVRVESVDDAAARAVLSGGAVVAGPVDVGSGARSAVLADPADAVFSVISGQGLPEMVRATPGAVVGCENLTRDLSSSLHFYRDMFGWVAKTNLDTGYVTFELHGDEVGGLMAMPGEVPAEAPSHWLVYFATSNCRETCDSVVALGGNVGMRPRVFEVADLAVMMAVAEDPSGAVFGLLQHPA
ncbi:MAG: VOC family protein [Acidimicrobiia bacterium]|nr:VOC family protein [Acidimicrobiia bacterium]MDH4308829.1 VOC family protein [Acidimicrobiia bacterium]MDH5292733.1 VOC family protein [Acidimicrobiia bacterium]